MRIGVVCEGPTDFHAIKYFFGKSLEAAGIETTFEAIQPEMDRTQPEGGWGNVLRWLDRNPPSFRIANFFGGGLFGGGLSRAPLDCIIIQLDTDVLGEESFGKHVLKNYNYTVETRKTPIDRANEIRKILGISGKLEEFTHQDVRRHVLAPAVESTEAWCVAAFFTPTENFELLSGQDLTNKFMSALEKSENREASYTYACIDKNHRRRENFCQKHSSGWNRIVSACNEFATVRDELVALST